MREYDQPAPTIEAFYWRCAAHLANMRRQSAKKLGDQGANRCFYRHPCSDDDGEELRCAIGGALTREAAIRWQREHPNATIIAVFSDDSNALADVSATPFAPNEWYSRLHRMQGVHDAFFVERKSILKLDWENPTLGPMLLKGQHDQYIADGGKEGAD